MSAHANPIAFTWWLEEKKGKDFLQELKKKSLKTTNFTIDDYIEMVNELKD